MTIWSQLTDIWKEIRKPEVIMDPNNMSDEELVQRFKSFSELTDYLNKHNLLAERGLYVKLGRGRLLNNHKSMRAGMASQSIQNKKEEKISDPGVIGLQIDQNQFANSKTIILISGSGIYPLFKIKYEDKVDKTTIIWCKSDNYEPWNLGKEYPGDIFQLLRLQALPEPGSRSFAIGSAEHLDLFQKLITDIFSFLPQNNIQEFIQELVTIPRSPRSIEGFVLKTFCQRLFNEGGRMDTSKKIIGKVRAKIQDLETNNDDPMYFTGYADGLEEVEKILDKLIEE